MLWCAHLHHERTVSRGVVYSQDNSITATNNITYQYNKIRIEMHKSVLEGCTSSVFSLISHSSVFLYFPEFCSIFFTSFFLRCRVSQQWPFSLNHYSSLVDPITLHLLGKHAEKKKNYSASTSLYSIFHIRQIQWPQRSETLWNRKL